MRSGMMLMALLGLLLVQACNTIDLRPAPMSEGEKRLAEKTGGFPRHF